MCALYELVGVQTRQLDGQHGLPQQAAKDRLDLNPDAIAPLGFSIRQLAATPVPRFMLSTILKPTQFNHLAIFVTLNQNNWCPDPG